jgi:hypothetical protein
MVDFFLSLKSRHKNHRAAQAEGKGNRKPKRFKRAASLKKSALRVIARAQRRQESDQQQENAEQRANEASLAKSTRTIATFTKALVYVGTVSAIITAGLWYEADSGSSDTHSLAEAARDQANAVKDQLAVMRIQADAAKTQAEAAAESASTAHQTMLSAQRAWIGPADARLEGELKQGEDLKAAVTYQNTGREPGYNFVNEIRHSTYTATEDTNGLTSANFGLDAAACLQREGSGDAQVVFPSTGFATYELRTTIDKSNINDSVISGESILFVTELFNALY